MSRSTETLSPALPTDIEEAAARFLKAACDRDVTVATAESCTGGMLAALLTDVEGASHAFDRGFVTYSKAAKCELLSIERTLVDGCGAVSAEVAAAMARGALAASAADIAVAVTGFAGQASPDDEAGLVFLATACRRSGVATREEHFGDVGRGEVRVRTLRSAIAMLNDALPPA